MTKVRIYYMAELERNSVKEAEHDVILHPNLLQHYETEVEVKVDNDYDPLRIDLDIRKDFDMILQLNKIDKKDFKDIDTSTLLTVYENITTKGTIFTGMCVDNRYEYVFYLAYKIEDIKIVRVLSELTDGVVGKLIAEDIAKEEPWEKPLA